jgi:Putative adhesin
MPTFDTPQPITVTVELAVGDLRIVAGDRADTVVEVRPSNSSRKGDVNAAQQTRVEFADGRLLVKAPKGWRHFTPLGGHESIDVEIALPTGSHLRGDAAVAALRATGRLGECRYKISAGNIHLTQTGPVQLKTSVGDITVDHIAGDAELSTASGALRVDRIDGAAVIKNSNGETRVGAVAGDLRVSAANGRIIVDHARSTVVAKTANGDVRIDEVARGAIQVETARGSVNVGIADGVAAWLDLKTQFGNVRNGLADAGEPQAGEDTVEVRARTAFGDITINRALASQGQKPGPP